MCRPYIDTNNPPTCNSAGLKIVPLLASSTFIAPYFHYVTAIVRVWIKWGKGGEFRQILKKKIFYLLSKGYTCHFKSEAFASFASIALRPCISFKLGHVFIPKRRIFLPLFLFCAYNSSVLQTFKIFTRLTEVTYHCIIFNDRVRSLELFWVACLVYY